ncbi:MAG: FtsW/RodA/SpoVE family cell cycle protein [Thermoflexales bacterium]
MTRFALSPKHSPEHAYRLPDWLLILSVASLASLGLVMAYSTTFYWSHTREGDPLAIFNRQLAFTLLGAAAFVIVSRLDYAIWRRHAVLIMLVSLIGLIAVALFGETLYGARRTLFGGSVQPSEFAKLALVVYAAAWLASRRDQVPSFVNGLLPFSVIIGVVIFLVVTQPDFSTAGNIAIIALTMFFISGGTPIQMLAVISLAALAFFGLTSLFPHAAERFWDFIQFLQNPDQANYHIRQALISMGDGGLWGIGIGAGGQKFGFLPTPHHDSVVAVLGEEMGLIGMLAMLGLFGLFTWRGIVIARQADTDFGAFAAIGIVTWVTSQMLLSVLAVLALIPFTGMPTPFISLGGSAMVNTLVACGLLVSISRGTQRAWEIAASRDTSQANTDHAHSHLRWRHRRTRPARAYRAEGARAVNALNLSSPSRGGPDRRASAVYRKQRGYGG